MNSENQNYHIDVTPEEDSLFREPSTSSSNKKKEKLYWSGSFTSIFWFVLGVHLIVGFAIFIMAASSANAEKSNGISHVSNNTTTQTLSPPIPTPTPITTAIKQENIATETKANLTKEYTIKKGDTIYSISRKYKLSSDRLLKINNIKDPNKIFIGQKLKFVE